MWKPSLTQELMSVSWVEIVYVELGSELCLRVLRDYLVCEGVEEEGGIEKEGAVQTREGLEQLVPVGVQVGPSPVHSHYFEKVPPHVSPWETLVKQSAHVQRLVQVPHQMQYESHHYRLLRRSVRDVPVLKH